MKKLIIIIQLLIYVQLSFCISSFTILQENKRAFKINVGTAKWEYFDRSDYCSISYISPLNYRLRYFKNDNSKGFSASYLNFLTDEYSLHPDEFYMDIFYMIGHMEYNYNDFDLNAINRTIKDSYLGVGIYAHINNGLELYSKLYYDRVNREHTKDYNYSEVDLGLIYSKNKFSVRPYIRLIKEKGYDLTKGAGVVISYYIITN